MSVDLSWTVDREGGARFVACRVHNAAAVPRRVRVRSRIDGPVLPPRRSGVPEAGWDAAGVTLRLEPGERRGVGFAAVAPADGSIADPPVEIADANPIDDADRPAVTADAAVRSLGDHRPPRDVLVDPRRMDPLAAAEDRGENGVVVDATPSTEDDVASMSEDGAAPSVEDDVAPSIEDDATRSDDRTPSGSTGDDAGDVDDVDDADDVDHETEPRDPRSDPEASPVVPPEADGLAEPLERSERRLEGIEHRIERAERLTDADLATATDAVDRLGGAEAVAILEERVADDATALRRLSERAASLAARAEETDVPTDALERLA
ncbi:DUF7857 domain-containing protein [Halorubrum aethiopicum]|uniref:DUF7857 domain-containing protein n=1 Tax=Halorubrum aethiopicum TaxID=1758255 RepID=UPI00082D69A5|nr:hypothetical protein [Halorubrum aethiopicum]